jgi:hypothetical protein
MRYVSTKRTRPIGFVVLTEYGFIKLALVILMVTGVHFVEVSLVCSSVWKGGGGAAQGQELSALSVGVCTVCLSP